MRILIVDDDVDQRTLIRSVLLNWGHQVETASDGVEALRVLPSFAPNVIVTDLKMPRMDGFQLMQHLKAAGSLPPTIVLTAFGSIELALETVHDYGGFWFLEKPVDMASLGALLQRAGEQGRLAAENERLRLELAQRGVLGELIGNSPEMQNVFGLIRQVAPTKAGVLITGESGSGKELAARAIHSFSQRSAEPFLAINCAALPEALVESELFGHEKGAFTGAVERRAGAMELAQKGTLFLDEIGEMPMPIQAKLLRVLEDFKFRRLGGKIEMQADVRLISATNRAPEKAIKEGKLREDLYYRLNVFHIELPPLRDRVQDIAPIAANMIEKLNRKYGTRVTHLEPSAAEALQGHRWIGNVRELRNVIERGVILAGEGPLFPRHLYLPKDDADETLTTSTLGVQVGMSIGEAERMLIEATLRQTKNNTQRTAFMLGTTTHALHLKLKEYGLEASGDGTPHQIESARA